MSHLDRQIAALPARHAYHVLAHRPTSWVLPVAEPCGAGCGALVGQDDLACPGCNANPCTALPPLEIVTGGSWLPLAASAQAIGRLQERNALRRLPAVVAERERRALQDAFLRSVAADARTADLLARRWLFMLDSEIAGGGS